MVAKVKDIRCTVEYNHYESTDDNNHHNNMLHCKNWKCDPYDYYDASGSVRSLLFSTLKRQLLLLWILKNGMKAGVPRGQVQHRTRGCWLLLLVRMWYRFSLFLFLSQLECDSEHRHPLQASKRALGHALTCIIPTIILSQLLCVMKQWRF